MFKLIVIKQIDRRTYSLRVSKGVYEWAYVKERGILTKSSNGSGSETRAESVPTVSVKNGLRLASSGAWRVDECECWICS